MYEGIVYFECMYSETNRNTSRKLTGRYEYDKIAKNNSKKEGVENKNVPLRDMEEQVIGAEGLNIDINQLTTTKVDSLHAHHLRKAVCSQLHATIHIVDIDDTPQERVLADPTPGRADVLHVDEDIKGA